MTTYEAHKIDGLNTYKYYVLKIKRMKDQEFVDSSISPQQ